MPFRWKISSAEDEAVNFILPADAFTDVDNAELTLTAALVGGADLPDWLSFDSESRSFTGQPPQDFNGTLEVAVSASDGEFTVTDSFALDITSVNDAPIVAIPLEDQSSAEDEAVNFILPADAFTDVDNAELTLTAALVGGADLPDWLSFDSESRSFTGQPPQDFNGTLEVAVSASDGEFTVTDSFALDITSVNDAPIVAIPLEDQSSAEDEAVNFILPADAFTDVDNAELTLTAALVGGADLPSWLGFDNQTGAFTGTPPASSQLLEIEVIASDGEKSASDVFVLEITDTNTAPTANNDGIFDVAENESVTILGADLLANDNDPDGDVLIITDVGSASNGTAELIDGNVRFTPNADYNGVANFSYTISDGNLESDAIVTLDVMGNNNENPYADFVEGTDRSDVLFGRLFSANEIYGAGGRDWIFGGLRDDHLAGGLGNDLLIGWFGNDTLDGNEGRDTLYGGWGNDILNGGAGNDRLFGSSGADILSGDEGNDLLWGGFGQDVFVFNEGDGRDQIRDFSLGFGWGGSSDRIRLDIDGVDSFEALLDFAAQRGLNTVLDFGEDDKLIVRNTRLSQLDTDNFEFV